MFEFRERVNDPFGHVRVPPFEKPERVIMIWVFVQVVDAVTEIVHEKKGVGQFEK